MAPPTASFVSQPASVPAPKDVAVNVNKKQTFAQRKGNANASNSQFHYDGHLPIKAGAEPREDYEGNVSDC